MKYHNFEIFIFGMAKIELKKLVDDIWGFVKKTKRGTDSHYVKQTEKSVREFTDIYRGKTMISRRAAIDWLESTKNEEEIPDPFTLPQKKFGGDDNGNYVTFDHTDTVKEFTNREIIPTESREEVERKLRKYPGLCIITREENKCLSAHGFMYERFDEGGWKKAYAKPPCKIEIMNRAEAQEFKRHFESNSDKETEKEELQLLATLHKSAADFKKFNPRAFRRAEKYDRDNPNFLKRLKYKTQNLNYKVRDDKFFDPELAKEIMKLKRQIKKIKNVEQWLSLHEKYAEILKRYPNLPYYYREEIDKIIEEKRPLYFRFKA